MPRQPMEQATFLDNALELLSNAIDAEDHHDYAEAYVRYMAALDYLMAAQQCVYQYGVVSDEQNDKSRAFLQEKADEYLNRAEAIRERVHVDTTKQPFRVVVGDVDGIKGHTTAQSVILDEAFKCAKLAIDADASRDYAEAYKQYMKSMDHFMFAQRYETDEQSRCLIRSEVAEYLSRAETIKIHLDSLKNSETRKVDKLGLSEEPPRPPEVVFLNTALDVTQRAIQQDVKKNYRSAYVLYNGAFDYFMLAYKYEKNEQTRTTIRASMEEYLTRAEALKKHI